MTSSSLEYYGLGGVMDTTETSSNWMGIRRRGGGGGRDASTPASALAFGVEVREMLGTL